MTAIIDPRTASAASITVRGLNKTYGEGDLAVHAVRDIDLDIKAGEVVLVMGPSGSGKTTLLLMLGAMLRPTSGAVTIDGIDLAAAPERLLPKLRARHLGFVFQDFNLLGALNAVENVEIACNLAGVVGNAAHERSRALLERVGLGQRLRFRPDQLSGGEKQRVSVARALANDPAVILADEPTANLDSSHGHDIARLLRHLATDDGRSVVIVSHDERLKEIADRVLWLEDGGFRELSNMATDPICGMSVTADPNTTLHAHRDGQTWWFCSTACRNEFTSRDPEAAADVPHETSGEPDPPHDERTAR
ncbi:MAG: ATP-binding cassette domain-containing protein [Actinobacteria bacterium]|nr:ATP-binding cassette domain-containing protein [Actinomycetota bacterium]